MSSLAPSSPRPVALAVLRALVVVVALGSLAPFVRIVVDWVSIARVLGEVPTALPQRGYDGVRWEDRGGRIVAAYVASRSPAERAGLRTGDALFALDGQQFFGADDVRRAVERASGARLTYALVATAPRPDGRPGAPRRVVVRVARYPVFLYPLNAWLWTASGWGLALATFLHALALAIVAPLTRRSKRAAQSALLIGAALGWVGGNLLRFLLVAAVGPPDGVGPTLSGVFEGLTLLALSGWVLFPALLFRYVLLDTTSVRHATRFVRPLVWVAPILLGAATITAVLFGSVGPIPPDALLAPILFYVCVYVGAATALILGAPTIRTEHEAAHPAPGWNRVGSAAVLVLSLLGALFAWGGLPGVLGASEEVSEWLVVLLQLLSVAPVVLLSLSSLRYGRFDRVLTRAVSYVGSIGAAFFGVAVGLWALRAAAPDASRSPLVAAAWLVAALVLLERITAPLRPAFLRTVQTERQRARQRLNRFGDRVRTYLDCESLATDGVQVVGEAMGARSAVLFLREPGDTEWVRAAYHPEPPYFSEAEMDRVWSALEQDGHVWSRIAELNEADLPEAESERLRQIGVALAVPVTSGGGEAVGALVLAGKSRLQAVYNLEDVEMLRALAGQLALAVERLGLIAREKALERETAEAQLAALRAQINPHFLFNALNTIAALIAARPAEAEQTVEGLARLFRHVLNTGARAFVPLEEEARLVREYLAIEHARFGDNLQVEEAWDPDTLATPVPAFAVQTLVENAVKHGIERKRGGGRVRVGSRRTEDGGVEIIVSDTGAGIAALTLPAAPDEVEGAAPSFFGFGLRNVAARLAQLYGRRDLLQHTSTPDEGTEARMLIPAAGPETTPSPPDAA